MAWIDLPPYLTKDPDGAYAGFFVELMALISADLNAELALTEVAGVPELIAAQNRGDTDVLAGVSQTADFEATNVFSAPISRTRKSLFMTSERAAQITQGSARGLRIGTMPGTQDSASAELLSRNIDVPFTSVEAALFSLLSGKIDGFLGSAAPTQAAIYGASVVT